jgi:hypothetical protein
MDDPLLEAGKRKIRDRVESFVVSILNWKVFSFFFFIALQSYISQASGFLEKDKKTLNNFSN